MAEVRTQGTELFLCDPAAPTAVITMACPTGITGLGGAADQIDITCLNSAEREFARGFLNPGQLTVPFVLYPTDTSHQTLFDLKESGDTLAWMIGLSDGTTPPTAVAGALVAPASTARTTFAFSGYIADITLDMATNEVVRGTLLIQRSGAVTTVWHD